MNTKATIKISLITIFLLGVIFGFIYILRQSDAWVIDSIKYQHRIGFTNTSTVPDYYQVKITVNTSTLTNFYCGGETWTNSSGDEIDFWREIPKNCSDYTPGQNVTWWVEVPHGGTIYLYYDNQSVVNDKSNGTNTFLFFDDFTGTTLDTSKWYNDYGRTATVGLYDGKTCVKMEVDGEDGVIIATKTNFTDNIRVRCYVYGERNVVAGPWVSVDLRDQHYTSYDYSKGYLFIYYTTKTKLFKSDGNSLYELDASTTEYLPDNSWDYIEVVAYNTQTLKDLIRTSIASTDTTYNSGYVSLGKGSQSKFYVDWIFVSNYTSPEPTYSQNSEEIAQIENSITLESPADNSVLSSFSQEFNYTPVFYIGNIKNCSLYTNETGWSSVAENSTPVINNSINTISHTFSSRGWYKWNIRCCNSTDCVFADSNRTFKIDMPPTWSNQGESASSITTGDTVNLYANFSDDFSLDYAWLSTNESGSWLNYSYSYSVGIGREWVSLPDAWWYSAYIRNNYMCGVWLNNSGYVKIRCLNLTDMSWSSEAEVSICTNENHRLPTVYIDENGYIYVFYDAGEIEKVKMRRSTTSFGLTFGSEKIIGAYCYQQPRDYGNSTIYLWLNDHPSGANSQDKFEYIYSNDNGSTWSSKNVVIDEDGPSARAYLGEVYIQGNKTYLAWSRFDSSVSIDRSGVFFAYNNGTDWMMANGTVLSVPFNSSTADIIEEMNTSIVSFVNTIEVLSNGNILISYTQSYKLKVALWNGTEWKIKVVDSWANEIMPTYATSALYAYNDTHIVLYANKKNSNGKYAIYRYESFDGGETWSSGVELFSSSSRDLFRINKIHGFNFSTFKTGFLFENGSASSGSGINNTIELYIENLDRVKKVSLSNYVVNFSWKNNYVDGIVAWKICANDTNGNTNCTDVQTFSVTEETVDNYPQYSNIKEPTDPSTYSAGATCQFNCTWTDDNGIDTVWLENNFTGTLTNTTITTYQGNEYYYDVSDLKAGTYVYRWFANDTAGQVNSTAQLTFTVSKASSEIALWINGTRGNFTTTNESAINITVDLIIPDIIGTVYIYRNDTLWDYGTSPLYNISENWTIGLWEVKANWSGNENYSSDYEIWYVNVTESTTTSTTTTTTSTTTTTAPTTSTTSTTTTSSTTTTTTILAGNPPEIIIHEPNTEIQNIQSKKSISDDSWIFSGSPNSNYGSAKLLNLGNDKQRIVLYEIDFNDIEDLGKIKNATLHIYQSGSTSDFDANVYYCDDTFNESSVTYNNAPSSCSLIETFDCDSSGWKVINITDKIVSEFYEDRRFTIRIEPSALGASILNFQSKEYQTESGKPYIEINSYKLATNKALLNFTVIDDYTTEMQCWYSINGSSETYMGYFANNTESTYLMTVPNVNNLHNLTVKCSDTLQNSTNSTEFYSVYPYVEIRAYDEDTGENIFFNVTISNSTISYKYEESYQNGFTKLLNETPINDVTIKITSENYESRFYYGIFDTHEKIDTYLLKSSDGLTYTFYVLTLGGMPIENATINVSTRPNTTEIQILQMKTNPDGSAAMFLKPNKEYSFSIEADGYITKHFSMITNPDSRVIYVRLLTDTEIEEVETPFSNVTYSITPAEQYQNESFTIHFIVNSNVTLDYFGMTIYYRNLTSGNSTLVYNYTIYNTIGGDLSYTTENVTGRWDVTVFIKHPDFSEWRTTKYYYIGYGSGFNILGISSLGYWIIAVIISIMVAGFFSRFVGVGAGFVGLAILSMFLFINPVVLNVGGVLISGWYILILAGIVYAIIVFLKSYI